MYAQRLEEQLQALQEKNRLLRNANGLSPDPGVDGVQGDVSAGNENSSEPLEADSEVMIVTSKSHPSPQESPDSSTKE